MKSAVLLLVFNRPDTTRQVFDAIRAARPPRLYVAADGPRASRSGEAARCAEARAIATAVDWPCEVRALLRDENLGCKHAVSSAIGWFFSQEPEGIILEDDILALPSFFEFCDQLLDRYRDDPRIAAISGCNVIADQHMTPASYFYSRYSQIWGWASWRRAWQHYDVEMKSWPEWRDANGLAAVSDGGSMFEFYWRRKLDATYAGLEGTWDYQWTYACWRQQGLTAISASNLIRNLGIGESATHTTGSGTDMLAAVPVAPLCFPLVHPEIIAPSASADALIGTRVYGTNVAGFIRRAPRRVVTALRARPRRA
jgi:hypothetical protein